MSVSKRFTKTNKVTVTFTVKKEAAQGAEKIDLLCEHNGWQAVALKPQKNGTFKGSIAVAEGEKPSYQYKFKYTITDRKKKKNNDGDAERNTTNPTQGEKTMPSPVRS